MLTSQCYCYGEIFGQGEVFVRDFRSSSGIILNLEQFFHRVDVNRKQSLVREMSPVEEDHSDVTGVSRTVLQHPFDALADGLG